MGKIGHSHSFFGENRTTEIMRTRPVAQQDEDIFISK
jgi:hypothetical protein